MRESSFEKWFKGKIEVLGGMCLKFWPGYFTGFPDRIVLMPGGFILFVETKTPTGKLSARQRLVHKMLKRLGFRIECITDKEEAYDLLETIKMFL
jgi:hypothetical protein